MKTLIKIRFAIFFFIGLFGSPFYQLHSSHIVGGELELVYTGRGTIYQIRMNMYFDDINAEPGLFESDINITVGIFQKSNDALVRTANIKRYSEDIINYSYNGCSDPSRVRNRNFKYSGNVDLEGLLHPEGYYLTWERCCRNYAISNIVHTSGGILVSGQVFYLEFPPIQKNNQPFINSSPIFKPVPADYLCRGFKYEVDYSCTDLEGDSLVYSLVSPIRGHTNEYVPYLLDPEPAPYDSILWGSGYGRLNMIPGSPALRIDSKSGSLSVTPNTAGLFVFGIRVEEFRDGEKIGEARRDFQYLVYDCPPNYGTSVEIDNVGNPDFIADTLIVPLNKLTCFNLFASDTNSLVYGENETILISTVKTNPIIKSTYYFTQSSTTLTGANPIFTSSMCFQPCNKIEPLEDTIVKFYIQVADVKCPSRFDTLEFYVKYVLPNDNVAPSIFTTLPNDTSLVYVDSLVSFFAYALDPDPSDLYQIEGKGKNFSFDYYGMDFSKKYVGVDSTSGRFSWIPDCEDLKANSLYPITFSVKDRSCLSSHQKDTTVYLMLNQIETDLPSILPPNLITPNEDNKNDCFLIPNMPPDNCDYYFKKIEIFNRWGSKVFMSTARNFEWCPENQTDGIYYYSIDLNQAQVKGWVQVIR